MVLEDKVKTRIEEVKQMRDKFVAQANIQISIYEAVISELEKLLISDTRES